MDTVVQIGLILFLLWIFGPWVIEVLRDIALQLKAAYKDVRGSGK